MASKSKHFPAKDSPPAPTGSSLVYWIVAVIALFGLADATFLTVAHLTGDDAVCGSLAGCSEVLGSKYAAIKGIPTAAFGALAYFTAFSLAILRRFWLRTAETRPGSPGRLMFIASLYFLYLQAFRLARFLSVLPLLGGDELSSRRSANRDSRRALKPVRLRFSQREQTKKASIARRHDQIVSRSSGPDRNYAWENTLRNYKVKSRDTSSLSFNSLKDWVKITLPAKNTHITSIKNPTPSFTSYEKEIRFTIRLL